MKQQTSFRETRLRFHLPPLTATCAAALALLAATVGPLQTLRAAPVPPHGVAAANIEVVINPDSTVTCSNTYSIGDFRTRDGSNAGDYNIQVGDEFSEDVDSGVLMTSIRQNGRDNSNPLYPGTNFCTSHLGVSETLGNAGGYWIPVCLTWPNAVSTSVIEYDMNVAAAWFPYAQWLGGYAHYSDNGIAKNNTTLDAFTGSPGLSLGIHFVDLGSAQYRVDLKSLGIDSRTDGVLLVLGAKNEDNYALSQVNTNNGTWTVFSKDNGTDTTSGEQDPIGFVFVPKTNSAVISGRFLGNGTIDMFSGAAPRFTITTIEPGRWELKMPGLSPAHGVLIISPEGGFAGNRDNIVSYEINAAGDGWIIESRDIPAILQTDLSYLAPLETPGDGTEPVASFAFILGATPGVTAAPSNYLQTSESGGTATFTVVLDTAPTADVTIALTSSDTTEGTVSPAFLTFTPGNWDLPQTVTVTGQDDDSKDGPIAYTIVLAEAVSADANYSGLNPGDVAIANTDNEAGITINPSGGLTTTEAGGTATFTVQLNTQPSADVSIALSSTDPSEGTVTPASLEFTAGNWNVPQTVTVTGVTDALDDGDIAFTLVTAPAVSADAVYNGEDAVDVTAMNLDDDTATIVITPDTLAIIEGEAGTYTVALTSEPTADVVVNVASGNTNGPVSPAILTFTPQNWATPQTVTVTAVDNLVGGGNLAVTVTNAVNTSDALYALINPKDVAVTLVDNEATITLPSGGAVYGLGMPGVGIDGRAGIVDPSTANYDKGTLTVTLTAGGTADDRLEVRNTGAYAGQIGVSGSEVSYEGTLIGSTSGGVGMAPLVVTLNTAATPLATEALLRSVTFRNTSSDLSSSLRSVEVVLADGSGGEVTATTTVRVGLLHVADFQEGADRGYGVYTGTADIELSQLAPDTALPTGHNGNGLWIDTQSAASLDACQFLMRFDHIVGNTPGQIPSNAVVVSAELILDVPANVSNAQGDASPLYRMLVPWDAENATYNSVGIGYTGFTPDDIHARSTYDSFLGLANGDANTGVGTIRLSVTADLQAWVNAGETNHGWLMPGWPLRLDGTAISPSEAVNIEARPRLRVLWLPEGTALASFRQGVNSYTNAHDTRLRADSPDAEASTVTGIFVDWSGNKDHVLLRFDDLIGSSAGQIPPYAQVHVAMLDLASMIGNAMGDGGTFHAMLQPWQDTNTWNSLVDGVTADGVEAAVAPTAVAGNANRDPNVQAAMLSFELTPDVQAWVNNSRPNYGWAILPWPSGSDGWGFGTAEQTAAVNRPQLRVYYTPGVVPEVVTLLPLLVTPTTVQVSFTGAASQTYSVQRVGALGAAWETRGTIITGADGKATFSDDAPLAGAAFYRVIRP